MECRKHFVLISLPRSGTKMLVGLLSSHPDIVCRLGGLSDRVRWREQFDRFVSEHPGKTVGVQIHPDLWEPPKSLLLSELVKIHLVRRDVSMGALSTIRFTRRFEADGAYYMDPKQHSQIVNRRLQYISAIEPYADLTVYYEDLAPDGDQVAELNPVSRRALLSVLEVPDVPLTTTRAKDLAPMPTNFADLRKCQLEK